MFEFQCNNIKHACFDQVVVSVKYLNSKDVIMIKIFHKEIHAGIGIMINLPFSSFDLYMLPFRPFSIPSQLISQKLIDKLLFNSPKVLSYLHECLSFAVLTANTEPTNFVCGFFSRSQPRDIICIVHMGLIKALGLRQRLKRRLSYKEFATETNKW